MAPNCVQTHTSDNCGKWSIFLLFKPTYFDFTRRSNVLPYKVLYNHHVPLILSQYKSVLNDKFKAWAACGYRWNKSNSIHKNPSPTRGEFPWLSTTSWIWLFVHNNWRPRSQFVITKYDKKRRWQFLVHLDYPPRWNILRSHIFVSVPFPHGK